MPGNVVSRGASFVLYEVLKKIQAGQARIIDTQADHSRQLLALRDDMNNLRRDDLRRETMEAQMDTRLDRIESRLELRNA